jgi:hypothetical protein
MENYNYGMVIFITYKFYCNLNLKQIVALVLSNVPAGVYFVLKYFSTLS